MRGYSRGEIVIEKLMSAGLLDAIFATATVAAGVIFRAQRCADGADARTAEGWRPLSASELQQMTGPCGTSRSRQVSGSLSRHRTAPGSPAIAQMLKAQPDPADKPVSRDVHHTAESA
jgi:superfamily II RNA helicase